MSPQRPHAQRRAEILEQLGVRPGIAPSKAERARARVRSRQLIAGLGIATRAPVAPRARGNPRFRLEAPADE